ncbi:Hypothetical protein PMT_2683 [Prochlorococcus marinus str. MIT 9313]|uniref:Uncharacterized protein n=1 Tax=Prochlorococcus marinus (strain MIT 9313) TaxID=74547 RepID=B9ES67_PROMM|nr:Hypothetical protein PMT_2683 [Prochlorococcus marinus str. MIT 9313]
MIKLTNGVKPVNFLSDEEARNCQKRWITKTKSQHRYRGKTIKKAPLLKRGFLVISTLIKSNDDNSERLVDPIRTN